MKATLSIIGQIVWKFLTVWLLRADAKADARREDDAAAHRRMNDADLGIGASDAANFAWLRDFADRHKR